MTDTDTTRRGSIPKINFSPFLFDHEVEYHKKANVTFVFTTSKREIEQLQRLIAAAAMAQNSK